MAAHAAVVSGAVVTLKRSLEVATWARAPFFVPALHRARVACGGGIAWRRLGRQCRVSHLAALSFWARGDSVFGRSHEAPSLAFERQKPCFA